MSNRKLYKEAIETFGATTQLDKIVEDCAGLIKAVQKYKQAKRIKKLSTDVAEEIADVEIICSQLRLLFPDVADIKKHKLERLAQLIKQTHEVWDKDNQEAVEEGEFGDARDPNKVGS